MAKARRKKLTKKAKRNLAIAGAVALGAYLIFRKRAPEGPAVITEMEPAAVTAGQLVNAVTYRIIANRRPGMSYTQAQSGGAGAPIDFTPEVSGMFTRNFVQEGNSLWAEVKR